MKRNRILTITLLVWFITASCNFPLVEDETELFIADPTTEEIVDTQQDTPELPSEETSSDSIANEIEIPESPTALIQPQDLFYLGAFRLPDGTDRPFTFEYGGNAMTLIPHDASEGNLPGSLVITGHDRLPYGEMTDGSQVAEVTIPQPVISKDVYALPIAEIIQPFADVAKGQFMGLDELPRIGLAYLDHPDTGPLIHIAWGAHFQEDDGNRPSHAWFSPDFSNPDFQGEWFLQGVNLYSANGYLFTIPEDWAEQFTQGKQLAAGRYRDGGWSGMGPNLYVYQPWLTDGSAPANGSQIPAIQLLAYENSEMADNFDHALNGYSHADEWEGAAWLSTITGKMAVIFTGTKATGEKTWYGWRNPQGAEFPCIETELRDQFTTCYLANGSPCPAEDLNGCSGHNDYRGWWSSAFEAQILFYNPDDLIKVAAGLIESWQPQPYAVLSLEDVLFHNPDQVEIEMLGDGIQAIHRIGAATFNPENGLLYVLELFADGAKPVVHVWQVND